MPKRIAVQGEGAAQHIEVLQSSTMTTTEDELRKQIRAILWPVPFDNGNKPTSVIVTGDITKHVYAPPYSLVEGQLISLLNTELHKVREDELNQIPHVLLHIPEVHEYKSKRLASIKENI